MTPREELQALLERVENAGGPDRELDAAIAAEIGEEGDYPGSHLLGGFNQGRAAWLLAYARPYTASVDAALALVERKLPGTGPRPDWPLWLPTIGRQYAGRWYARLYRVTDGLSTDADARTPALAIIAALLKALIASPASPTDRPGRGPGKPENETPRERAG